MQSRPANQMFGTEGAAVSSSAQTAIDNADNVSCSEQRRHREDRELADSQEAWVLYVVTVTLADGTSRSANIMLR